MTGDVIAILDAVWCDGRGGCEKVKGRRWRNRWRARHPNTAYLRDKSDAEDDYKHRDALVVPLHAFEHLMRRRVSVSQALMCARAASRIAVMEAPALRKKPSQIVEIVSYSH